MTTSPTTTSPMGPAKNSTRCDFCPRIYECQVRLVHHILADHPGILPLKFDDSKTIQQRLDEVCQPLANEQRNGNCSTNQHGHRQEPTNQHAHTNGILKNDKICIFCNNKIAESTSLEQHLHDEHGIYNNSQQLINFIESHKNESSSATLKRSAFQHQNDVEEETDSPIDEPPQKISRICEAVFENVDAVETSLVNDAVLDTQTNVINGHAADETAVNDLPRILRSRSRNSFSQTPKKLDESTEMPECQRPPLFDTAHSSAIDLLLTEENIEETVETQQPNCESSSESIVNYEQQLNDVHGPQGVVDHEDPVEGEQSVKVEEKREIKNESFEHLSPNQPADGSVTSVDSHLEFDARYYAHRPSRCSQCPRAYTTSRALGHHVKTKHCTKAEQAPVLHVPRVPTPPPEVADPTTVFTTPSLRPRRQAAVSVFTARQPSEPTFNETYYSTRVFRCTLCPRAYTLAHNLRSHCKQAHDGDGMTDSIPSTTSSSSTPSLKSYPTKPRNANNQPTPDFTPEYYASRPNLCYICPKGFERRDNLRRHVINVHKVPFDCPPPSITPQTHMHNSGTTQFLQHSSGSVADTPSPSVSNPQQMHSVESHHSHHDASMGILPTTAVEQSTSSPMVLPPTVTEHDIEEMRDLFQPSPRRQYPPFSSAAY